MYDEPRTACGAYSSPPCAAAPRTACGAATSRLGRPPADVHSPEAHVPESAEAARHRCRAATLWGPECCVPATPGFPLHDCRCSAGILSLLRLATCKGALILRASLARHLHCYGRGELDNYPLFAAGEAVSPRKAYFVPRTWATRRLRACRVSGRRMGYAHVAALAVSGPGVSLGWVSVRGLGPVGHEIRLVADLRIRFARCRRMLRLCAHGLRSAHVVRYRRQVREPCEQGEIPAGEVGPSRC